MKKFKNKKKYINNKKNDNNKFNIVSVISMVLIVLICSSILIFVGFSMYIYMNAPEFNTSLLYKNESSNIYDNKGDLCYQKLKTGNVINFYGSLCQNHEVELYEFENYS